MTEQEFTQIFKRNYKSTSSFLSGLTIMLGDIIGIFFCIGISFFIVNLVIPESINFRSFIWYNGYTPLLIFVFYAAGLYPGIMSSPSEEVKKLCTCSALYMIALILSVIIDYGEFNVSHYINVNEYLNPKRLIADGEKKGVLIALSLTIPLFAVGLPTSREITRHILGKFRWWGVPAILYDTNGSSFEICSRLLKRKELGYKPAMIISNTVKEMTAFEGIPIFPESEEILTFIKKLKIKVAMLCDYSGKKRDIYHAYRYTIQVSSSQEMFTSTMQLKDIGGILGFSSTHNLTKKLNLFAKRCIDLFLVLIASPVLIPATIFIGIGIKCSSRGPVFYGHKRVGKNGKIIKCWKFRSMYNNSQEMLEKILAEDPVRREEWERDRKFVDDPRVTKFGKFLRKTSLDELPQLFNILAGNMSFVGPRPVTSEELEKYGEMSDIILTVTPGLSGMWQISGRSDTGYEERVVLDTYYIQNWSVWLDLWIIIKTVWVVLKGKGAY